MKYRDAAVPDGKDPEYWCDGWEARAHDAESVERVVTPSTAEGDPGGYYYLCPECLEAFAKEQDGPA